MAEVIACDRCEKILLKRDAIPIEITCKAHQESGFPPVTNYYCSECIDYFNQINYEINTSDGRDKDPYKGKLPLLGVNVDNKTGTTSYHYMVHSYDSDTHTAMIKTVKWIVKNKEESEVM